MKPSPVHSRLGRVGMGAALALCTLALLCYPQEATVAARDGLGLCGSVIIPSLFPFFVLSSLVVSLDFVRPLGRLLAPIMTPLFHLNGSCASALALGLVGGYPVGARTAGELVVSGDCSKEEGERLLAFCNNCGPAFVLGAVGVGVFRSVGAGVLLYAVHVLAALLTGFLLQGSPSQHGSRPGSAPPPRRSFADAFTGAVKSALHSILSICAFVVFFTVLARLLSLTGILPVLAGLLSMVLPLSAPCLEGVLVGLLEVSTGVLSLTEGTLPLRLVAAAGLLGWGGLCVHCQALSCLSSSGLSTRRYFLGKALHGLLSVLLMLLVLHLLPTQVVTVFSPIAPPTVFVPNLKGVVILHLLFCLPLAILWLWATLWERRGRRKRGGKKGRDRV